MIRPFELFVGLRYIRPQRRDHFVSFISLISILGIIVGITALITVLSVMNGFGKELRGRILGVISHVTVTGVNGTLHDWQAVDKKVATDPRVVAAAPYVAGQAMIARGKNVSGTLVRGILPDYERKVSELANKVIEGNLDDLKPGSFGLVIGSALAWKLDLTVGSSVSIVVPQAQTTPAGMMPRFKRFTVVGIFRADMYEYDSGLVLMHLADAAKLYRLGDVVSGLRLRVTDVDRAPFIAFDIDRLLGMDYRARDWTREHGNFFRALKIEKTAMFIILLLIVAVAMFNVVSTLVVIVTEKQADIAILRTLGASPGNILAVFMIQGAFVGVVGTIVGTACGVLLAFNVETIVKGIEAVFSTTFIAADVYFISELPSDVHWNDVFFIAGASLVLGLLSTIYPAWRASRVQPAEALRYE